MTWKKAVFAVIFAGALLVATAGCGDKEVNTSAPQPFSTTGSHIPAPPTDDVTMPAPPEGFTPGEIPAMPEIDWSTAAAELGVIEDRLKEALGDFEAGPPDLAAAAAELGVTEAALREALGFPAGGPPGQGVLPLDGAGQDTQGNIY